MKHRKDSEADRHAVMDTAAMQSKGTTEAHRPERSLRQNPAAGILALVVAMGVVRFAYTPILPACRRVLASPTPPVPSHRATTSATSSEPSSLTYARMAMGPRKTGLAIGTSTAVYGIGQVLGPLVAVALAGGPKGFAPALIAASSAVALGGLLMTALGLFGATKGGKEYVYGNGH